MGITVNVVSSVTALGSMWLSFIPTAEFLNDEQNTRVNIYGKGPEANMLSLSHSPGR